MQITQIPGKMVETWNDEVKAVVDTWTSYGVKLDEFKEAVLGKGLAHSKLHQGRAWIVDSSKAVGSFSSEIQDFIGTEVFKSFAKGGVKYFITITSASAVTKLTIRSYSAKVGPSGIQLVEVASVEDAVDWLKVH